MERWLFVVNPAAGKGKAARWWNRYSCHLSTFDKPWDVYYTRGPGDAERMAREVVNAASSDVIVAVGGDGTIHELVQGLAGSSVALGILPAGTGNDLARYFGIRRGPEALLQLKQAIRHQVDLVKMAEGVFLNIAGTGFDARVASHVNRSFWLKRWGPVGYVWSVGIQLMFFRPQSVRVEVDGCLYTYRSAWMVAVGNGTTYAGGMRLLPLARMDDGELDVCVVDGISKAGFCCMFPTVFWGKHVGHPAVHFLRGKRVAVHPAQPWPVHADGEVLSDRIIEVEVWPKSLIVLRPCQQIAQSSDHQDPLGARDAIRTGHSDAGNEA
ncbi:MAG: diacylglycerol kinase family lipid kinase [Alicyclobacillaceae bacterium]|nr:diacylglycerol kinase family lipid kinase [Alicyclobacillaceae bacterium]